MHRSTISILCTLLPFVLADQTCTISDLHIWQYTKSPNYILEEIPLGVNALGMADQVVTCDLTWNVSAAALVPATGPPLIEHLDWNSRYLNVTMQRMAVDPLQPWYLAVAYHSSWSDGTAVVWNPYRDGPIPVRGGNATDSRRVCHVEYGFVSNYTIGGAPSVTLPEALRLWNDPNVTAAHSRENPGWG